MKITNNLIAAVREVCASEESTQDTGSYLRIAELTNNRNLCLITSKRYAWIAKVLPETDKHGAHLKIKVSPKYTKSNIRQYLSEVHSMIAVALSAAPLKTNEAEVAK